MLFCLQQQPYNNIHLSTILPDTTVLTCIQQPSYNNIHLSIILPDKQLYLPAFSNHLTITSTCLPYYKRHNCTYPPTAATFQKHPDVYHTTRDTNVLSCIQQPPSNNIHLSTILPETQLCFLAYSNHLQITSTCLPYYQKYTYTYLLTAAT